MSREATQKSGVPQIIKSDMALKLAEQWVNNMTKVGTNEQTEAESEGRPSRLGLGTKFSRQRPSNDPVERKLYANLQSGKRKRAKDAEESGLTARDPGGDSDIDDGLESRASAFAKKRVITPPVPLTMKKKRREPLERFMFFGRRKETLDCLNRVSSSRRLFPLSAEMEIQ